LNPKIVFILHYKDQHGSEAWTIRKQDEQRLTTAETKVMRTAGYCLLDRMRNKHILDEMKVIPVTEYVNNYRQNWLQHVKDMDRARIPKKNVSICRHWTDHDCQEDRRVDGRIP
jgi:hypothetical protein